MICVKYLSLVTDCCSYFVAVLARAQWPGWDAGAWPQLGPAASRGGSDTAKADWASGLSPGPIPASDTRKTRGQSNIRIPKGDQDKKLNIQYSILMEMKDYMIYSFIHTLKSSRHSFKRVIQHLIIKMNLDFVSSIRDVILSRIRVRKMSR